MRIGFIIQSGRPNFKPFRNQPLVALYLLTILEERFSERIRLSLIDLRGVEEDSILYHIQENDIFLYSVTSPDFDEIPFIVQKIRTVYPKAKHIAGGPHVNHFPEQCSALFDSIVLGEGEESIVNLINDVFTSEIKPLYREVNPINLDMYPYPSRKYLPKTAVVGTGILDGKYFNLRGTTAIFSRGCPFNCHFCANLNFGQVRFRSPALIKEEIAYLKKEYNIEALAIKDDNSIPVASKIAKPLLEAIGQTEIKWRGQSRANGVHPDMVKLAWEAGCTDIAVGIESVSPVVLKLVNKKIDIEQAKEYIRLLNKTGIGARLHFIFGLPGETNDIVRQTLQFINDTNPRSVLLSLFCPLPGSEFYKYPERYGININVTSWNQYRVAFGRFDANELPMMVFEYNKVTPWGTGMSKDQILRNYIELQTVLRERGLNF